MDARTWEYKLLQKTRAEMSAHIGAKPSAVQLALVERASQLTLHLAKQDARTAAGELMSEFTSRQYLAWSNSLVRTMKALGLKGAAERGPTLADHIARRGVSAA